MQTSWNTLKYSKYFLDCLQLFEIPGVARRPTQAGRPSPPASGTARLAPGVFVPSSFVTPSGVTRLRLCWQFGSLSSSSLGLSDLSESGCHKQ